MFKQEVSLHKIDVEILWTLKQSTNHALSINDIVEKNKRLSINAELKEKLQFLTQGKIIQSTLIPTIGDGYQITKEGNDLIWNGETWEQIFNLIKLVDPEKYTSNEIRRITNKSIMETVKGIEYLRKGRNLIEGESKGFKLYFVLSEKGRSYSDEDQKIG